MVPLTKTYSNSASNRFGESAFSGEAEGTGVIVGEELVEGEGVAGVSAGVGCVVDLAGESGESGGTVTGLDGSGVSVFVGLSVRFNGGFGGWLTTMADATVIKEHVRTTAITMTVLLIAIKLDRSAFLPKRGFCKGFLCKDFGF